ncbi:hypothetical protein DFP72DRAFT_838609 [Ephemerocybe angulata]|uniref:Uncharacterized protein n=1 Tax=Ephemerocybe angulata TaxID=980116 RepID=A0A8H6IKZ8_9AGAR|nr:hypothetical protein DFP72DRAFT_838609 [Tulosesus angulatus]
MAAQSGPSSGPRRNPPRLNIINPSISYSQQQAQALFSPALQTAIHTGMGNGFPLHTPMQPFFNGPGQPPNAPPRRGHQGRASISHFPGHQSHQSSISHFPGHQSHQSITTPIGGHFPRASMMLPNGAPSPLISVGPPGPGQPLGPIIINNGPPTAGHRPHRRQMSIGGPPKAVLGGPQRKVSPNPAAAAIAAVGAATLKKKITVNLPKETELLEEQGEAKHESEKDEEGEERESEAGHVQERVAKDWARVPLPVAEGEAIMASHLPIPAEDLISREQFPSEDWKSALPGAIDVFLPSKSTWDTLKQQIIEAKLEKLGVERGSGSNVPHIFAPHARAASISSPADPALLHFKLNKLQQSQSGLALSPSIANSNSLAASPQPLMGVSPPPNNLRHSPLSLSSNGDTFQNRHGHTMSLAQPPSYMQNGGFGFNFNPFGPPSVANVDDLERPLSTVSDGGIVVPSSLAIPSAPSAFSRPGSRPDFIRGFGLDVPEEAEEEAELDAQEKIEHELRWKRKQELSDEEDNSEAEGEDSGHTGDTEDADSDGEADMDLDDDRTAPQSTAHSRHVSRISAALSLRSVGGNAGALALRGEGDLETTGEVNEEGSFIGRESSPASEGSGRPPTTSIFGHAVRQSISANREDLEDAVAVQEWTASEEEEGRVSVSGTDDLSDLDDEQSLGEFSNPSDEERARQERVDRRMESRAGKEEAKRRKRLLKQRISVDHEGEVKSSAMGGDASEGELVVDQPRRIPNFPRPPDDNLVFVPTQREHYHHPQAYPAPYRDRDEIISNPSEENLVMDPHEYRYVQPVAPPAYPPHIPAHHPYQQPQFLGITPSSSQVDFYNGPPRSPGGTRLNQPLPAIGMPIPHSHSRGPSEALSYASHGHQGSFGHEQPSFVHSTYNHQHQGSFGQQSSSSFGQAAPAFGLVSPPQQYQQHEGQTSVTSPPGNSSGRRDSLNPFAKPFVFGQPLSAKAEPWVPGTALASSTSASSPNAQTEPAASPFQAGHSRLSSLGKLLNVAAPEFKPRSGIIPTDAEFTFSMPTATPAFPVAEPALPLSALAASSAARDGLYEEDGSPIKKQGREKRPRLGSSYALGEGGEEELEFVEEEVAAEAHEVHRGGDISPVEEGDSMASFRFPHGPGRIESPRVMRKAYSHQPQQAPSGLSVDMAMSTPGSLDGQEGSNFESESDGHFSEMEDLGSEEEDKENRREDTPAPAPTSLLMQKPTFLGDRSRTSDVETVGNDAQDTAKSPTTPTEDASHPEYDEDEYVQELIIPPTLPVTNLSATFPTSATMRTSPGAVSFSPINSASNKSRRAPIPLDFKHPTGNTVPAGLFKALVQGVIQQNRNDAPSGSASPSGQAEDRRARLSSREVYETHMSRPSLDDLHITKISGTGIPSNHGASSTNANRSIHLPNFTGTVANRARNATDPMPSLHLDDEEDVFGSRNANISGVNGTGIHRRRRSSLPDALRDPSSASEADDDHDSDAENRYGNMSLNANPSHTVHLSQSGRRVLRSLSISRSQSPESARMQRMRSAPLSPAVRPSGLGSQFELHALEDVLSRVLDERLSELRREWNAASTNGKTASAMSSNSEAELSEVISLFRTQLQESAAKSLEDTTMEARGDMDMFMIKEMLEDGQKEVIGAVKSIVEAQLHHALTAAQQASSRTRPSDEVIQEVRSVVENAAGKTIGAVVETIADLRARQEAAASAEALAQDHERLLDDLVATLTPMLHGLRGDPIDYEFLTSQLTQAVKPHITQLIDLASDKKETASLIVDSLVPTLVGALVPSLAPSLAPSLLSALAPTLLEALSERLRVESDESRRGVVREVRKAVEGVDAIEIRERVADLVVERLDARLDARDKSFLGAVNSTVKDVVDKLTAHAEAVGVKNQQALTEEDLKRVERGVVRGVKETVANFDRVPVMLDEWLHRAESHHQAVVQRITAVEKANVDAAGELKLAIDGAVAGIASKQDVESLDQHILSATTEAIQGLSTSVLVAKNEELVASQQAMATKISSLPETLNSAIVNLQNGVSELIVSRDVPKRDLEELKKLNSEYQVQLTKARAAHGQVRVEKDMLGEKLLGMESERDRLRARVAELEKDKKEDITNAETRRNELEEALTNALGRLQASDVASQMHQQRIAELETTIKESSADKTTLKAKLDALEIRATIAEKEKDSVIATLESVRSDQTNWEGLRQASEKIDMLTSLLGEVESDELKDLRRYHDRTKNIESEYVSLQKRCKELETKALNSEKLASAAKSSLVQTQQRSAEWEKRAKEYEGELEMIRTKLEQAEQTHSQLDADHSLLKLQFEEKEADDRLNKDRENKQRDQIAALETKVVRLQDELVKARTGARTPYRSATNGTAHHSPPRPDSRASVSTVNGGRGDRRLSSYSPANGGGMTPPTASVWHSIHAPSNDSPVPASKYSSVSGSIHAPKSRYANLTPASTPRYPSSRKPTYPSRANAPSPAPSAVSAAPTQRDDGWWE